MQKIDCPCIKQEICNDVYWVTNDCANGIKEGFRPRVTFAQTCKNCQSYRANPSLQNLKQVNAEV